MARQAREQDKRRLGGKEFPVHQLRESMHFTIGLSCVIIFLAPYAVTGFVSANNDQQGPHTTITVLLAIAVVLVCLSIAQVRKWRRIAGSTYSPAQLAPLGGKTSVWRNRLRWFLAAVAAAG